MSRTPAQFYCYFSARASRSTCESSEVASARVLAYFVSPYLISDRSWLAHIRWFTITQLNSSLTELYEFARSAGPGGFYCAWPRPSGDAWKFVVAFGVVQAVLQLLMPGKTFLGPVSPKGNTPVYKVTDRKPERQATSEALQTFLHLFGLGLSVPAPMDRRMASKHIWHRLLSSSWAGGQQDSMLELHACEVLSHADVR